MRKQVLTYCFCFLVMAAGSQTVQPGAYNKEITFNTDNDAYLFKENDAYYTNGFFFALRTAREKKGKKIIQAYEIGQMIFTPFDRKTTSAANIDRPYCGYLYFQFKQTAFRKDNAVLQYNLGLGQVGDASLGEAVQNSYHKLLGYSRFSGWPSQVQNALGVDVGISYAHSILEDDTSWIKLMPVVQANLGMNFTNAKLGAYLCIGAFESNRNSALWNARVQTQTTVLRRKYELFVYWYPQLILQGYNSTVQGGLLSKGNGAAVLGDIEPVMFQHSIGLCYAEGRWTTNLAFVHQSKEATSQKYNQQYGSVQVSYRLH